MKTIRIKSQMIIEQNLTEGVMYILEKEQCKNILVLADEHVAQHPDVVNMVDEVAKNRKIQLMSIPSGEPTTDLVNKITNNYRGVGIDFMIAIGGGSVIDLTKAVSALLVNEGLIEDYHGTGKLLVNGIRKASIPTTAGTGCDVTEAAVLINPSISFKRGVIGPGVGSNYTLICGKLSTSLGKGFTVFCAMDAMAHAVESYVSSKASIVTKMFSREAFQLIYNNLPKVLEAPVNPLLREKLLIGSALAGYAIDNSGTGSCHAISYAPGVLYHVPHSSAITMMYVETIKINIEKGCYTYAELYQSIPGIRPSFDPKTDANAFFDLMRNYEPIIKYRKRLSDYGAKINKLDYLVNEAMKFKAALAANPVEFDNSDAYRVFKEVF